MLCSAGTRSSLGLAACGESSLLRDDYFGRSWLEPSRSPTVVKRDGTREPVTILSVSRLVEKKGVDVLLQALARLPAALRWKLVHAGGGPLSAQLKRKARFLKIQEKIEWRGALTQEELLAEYRKADLFALASRVARDGDRDGLPNVLAEAQSQGLACVATRVSAIPELLRYKYAPGLAAAVVAAATQTAALVARPAGSAGRKAMAS